MAAKQYDSNYNDALGYIISVREKFIEPILPLLEQQQDEPARKKITSLVAFTRPYIKHSGKIEDVKKHLATVNKVVSKEYLKASQDMSPEAKKIKTASIGAMYEIISVIVEVMVDLNMFVVLSKRKTYEQQLGGDD